MPIYDYRCTDCGTVYDVFHKVREVKEDVVCPSCASAAHLRLLSAPAVLAGGSRSAAAELPACGADGCCGGGCMTDA